ncbi:Putative multidrug resistance protein MdtD [Streptomyces alboniger]
MATAMPGGLEDLEWTVSAYTLTFAVLLMFGASLGDRFGRRRLFAIGLGIFTTASASAALAPGAGELIAARAAQGVGSAIVTPLALTLLSDAVTRSRQAGVNSGADSATVTSRPRRAATSVLPEPMSPQSTTPRRERGSRERGGPIEPFPTEPK